MAVPGTELGLLVAWLRRLGMPLARIESICGLPGPEAATGRVPTA